MTCPYARATKRPFCHKMLLIQILHIVHSLIYKDNLPVGCHVNQLHVNKYSILRVWMRLRVANALLFYCHAYSLDFFIILEINQSFPKKKSQEKERTSHFCYNQHCVYVGDRTAQCNPVDWFADATGAWQVFLGNFEFTIFKCMHSKCWESHRIAY